jgi:hypothetical protein
MVESGEIKINMKEEIQIKNEKVSRILLSSMLIPFSLVIVIAILSFLISLLTSRWDIEFILSGTPVFIFISIMVLFCRIAEWTYLRKPITKSSIINLLIIETIIAAALSFHLFFIMLLIGGIGNLIRYYYLKSKLNI